MSRVLPILFNTEMVRAILDGRKTVTRRVVKPQPQCSIPADCLCLGCKGAVSDICNKTDLDFPERPYQPGDILYVRETWQHMHDTEQMMKELGYELHARMVWDKENGIAPAFTVRFTHEYLLWFYRKGAMLMPCKEMRGKYTTVLREMSTTHSTKPVCAYEMIENMFPSVQKLEMFARNERDGWDCWGDEMIGFERCEKPEREGKNG